MDLLVATLSNDYTEFQALIQESRELLEFLKNCNNLVKVDVYKKLQQLSKWLISTRGKKIRPQLAFLILEHLDIFPKFWYGLNKDFHELTSSRRDTEKKAILTEKQVSYSVADQTDSARPSDKENLLVLVFTCFLDYFVEYTDYSKEVCRAFGENGYLDMILTGLQSEILPDDCVYFGIAIIYNCCRRITENRQLCRRGIGFLEDHSKSSVPRIQAVAFFALSYIVNKAEAHKLDLNKSCIKFLLNNLNKALDAPDRLSVLWAEEIAQGNSPVSNQW